VAGSAAAGGAGTRTRLLAGGLGGAVRGCTRGLGCVAFRLVAATAEGIAATAGGVAPCTGRSIPLLTVGALGAIGAATAGRGEDSRDGSAGTAMARLPAVDGRDNDTAAAPMTSVAVTRPAIQTAGRLGVALV